MMNQMVSRNIITSYKSLDSRVGVWIAPNRQLCEGAHLPLVPHSFLACPSLSSLIIDPYYWVTDALMYTSRPTSARVEHQSKEIWIPTRILNNS